MKKRTKRVIALVIAIILAGMAILGGIYAAVYSHETKPDDPRSADCIIVLGNKVNTHGPSLSLEGRLNRALELYEQGYARALIVCGGQGGNEPATEASVMAGWLVDRGVGIENIYLDETSRNTVENIAEAKVIMDEQMFDTAIVCTSDFHSYRAMRIAEDAGLTAYPAKARTDWPTKATSRLRECLSWIKYFLGL